MPDIQTIMNRRIALPAPPLPDVGYVDYLGQTPRRPDVVEEDTAEDTSYVYHYTFRLERSQEQEVEVTIRAACLYDAEDYAGGLEYSDLIAHANDYDWEDSLTGIYDQWTDAMVDEEGVPDGEFHDLPDFEA